MNMHNTLNIHYPKYVKINTLNIDLMENVKYKIKSYDIYDRKNKSPTADPNFNYEIIYEEIIHTKKQTHAKQISKILINTNTRNQHGSLKAC